jgi:hypothetical protein
LKLCDLVIFLVFSPAFQEIGKHHGVQFVVLVSDESVDHELEIGLVFGEELCSLKIGEYFA